MNRKTSGFTLIELLVVIAIIAILAAILFPVFVSAKAGGKRSADLVHQRQMGMALGLYADDYQGIFPRVTRAGTLRLFPEYPSGTNVTISGELIVLLKSYAKSKQAFYCSAVDAYGKQYTYAGQSGASPPFMFTGFYYFICDGWSGPNPIRQSGNPRRILVQCIGGGVTKNTGGPGEGSSGHGPAQAIYTFADGHSRFVRHFKYPYSYTDCQTMNNMSKLLMPSW